MQGKTSLETILLKDCNPIVTIDKQFIDKIKFLCKYMPEVEWSGILYYNIIKGSIKKPNSLKIKLEDIFLMDKGTKAFTSYSFDEDVVSNMMSNPTLLRMKIGHIHSHNTMKVFFSQTDTDELKDNSPNHNFYLSVIVNNYLDITAKIAFIVEEEITIKQNIKVNSSLAKDENGQNYSFSPLKGKNEEKTIKTKTMYHCDCIITTPKEKNIFVPDSFQKRYEQVLAKHETELKKKQEQNKNKYPNHNQKLIGTGLYGGWTDEINSINNDTVILDYNPNDMSHVFALALIKLGNQTSVTTPEEIFEEVENEANQHLAASVVENYSAVYQNVFDKHDKVNDEDMFLAILNDVIDFYCWYESDYLYLSKVIKALELFRKNITQP